MEKILIRWGVAIALLASASAFAAGSLTTSEAMVSKGAWYSNMSILGGFKTYQDSGRVVQMQDPNGLNYKSKSEFFLGARSKAGWGGYVQGVQSAKVYGDSSRNKLSPGDPSVTFMHPTLYDSGKIKVSGSLRQYFPVSDHSVKNQIYQTAYYSILNVQLKRGYDVANVLIPRYFSQPKYAASHTTFYVEDRTSISKNFYPWMRVGVAQYTQWENHQSTPSGFTSEFIPYADFMLTSNIYAGPRISFPLYVKDVVFDAPTNVSTGNIQAEIYLQATL